MFVENSIRAGRNFHWGYHLGMSGALTSLKRARNFCFRSFDPWVISFADLWPTWWIP